MSNLDNLVSKIMEDGKSKAGDIIDNAKTEATSIISALESDANKTRDEILLSAELEAAMQKEQVVAGTKIEIRDSLLKAKRETMEKTLAETVKRLKNMNIDEYSRFFSSYAMKLDLKGDEKIIVPSKYKGLDLSKINKALAEKGKKGELSLLKDAKEIDGGFIVLKDGIENNNTFESLVDYYRDDLERTIVENLFA